MLAVANRAANTDGFELRMTLCCDEHTLVPLNDNRRLAEDFEKSRRQYQLLKHDGQDQPALMREGQHAFRFRL